jgi:molybdate transport system substrate-binding protein
MSKLSKVAAILAVVAGIALPAVGQAQDLTVFAAASLKNALDDAIAAWKKDGGKPVAASYASSSTLAKQIEQAAPADIFISADRQWMDYLATRGLVKTPHDLLGNRLVLIAAADDPVQIDLRPGVDLAARLGGGRLAVGDPAHVPAGIYAKEALEKLGVWQAIEAKLAPAADVRAALALVSRREAPLGVVYETDALVDPGVRIAGLFPDDTHAPILYPIAVATTSKNPDAAAFVAFLDGPAAGAIFRHYGFAAGRLMVKAGTGGPDPVR